MWRGGEQQTAASWSARRPISPPPSMLMRRLPSKLATPPTSTNAGRSLVIEGPSPLFESMDSPEDNDGPSSEFVCEHAPILFMDGPPGSWSTWPSSVKFSRLEPPSSNRTDNCFAIEERVKLVEAVVPPWPYDASTDSSPCLKTSLKREPQPLLFEVLVSVAHPPHIFGAPQFIWAPPPLPQHAW